MTTDFRAMCAELTDVLDGLFEDPEIPSEIRRSHSLEEYLTRARAALADEPAVPEGREPASVTEQPSDEALYDYWISTSPEFGCADPVGFARAVLARWGTPDLAETRSSLGDAPQPVPLAEGEVEECTAELEEQKPRPDYDRVQKIATEAQIRSAAQYLAKKQHCDGDLIPAIRYAIARWGHRPAPPAEGEVAELVRMLTGIAHWRRRGRPGEGDPSPFDIRQADRLDRAANLLERLSPPVPVPVSERSPAPEDCDAEHYCWRWNTIGGLWARQPLARRWYEFESHWLPAHALPLPTAND